MDKEILIRNFSRYAHLYDKYSNIQRMAAEELLVQVPRDGIKSILEIGCGTGNYTALLRKKFETANVKALDISGKMVEIAQSKLRNKKIEFLVVDAEKLKLKDRFDFITSNAAFQWLQDLECCLTKYKNALIANGVISFSIFGPITFCELRDALQEFLGEDLHISADNFPDKRKLKQILTKNFSKVSIKERIIKEKYPSLRELLNTIKYTGTRGSGLSGSIFLGKRSLKKIEEIYKSRFGRIQVSYQIFFCRVSK